MIKSRFKKWGVLAMVMTVFSSLFLIGFICILASAEFFDGHFFKAGSTLTPSETILFISILLLLQLLVVRTWIMYCFILKIDAINNTIWFKNIFTQQTSHCSFSDFDGYIEIVGYGSRSGSYKILYLIKNKKAIVAINDYYYANLDEMRRALSSITYLGVQKNWRQILRRTLFNRPLLD